MKPNFNQRIGMSTAPSDTHYFFNPTTHNYNFNYPHHHHNQNNQEQFSTNNKKHNNNPTYHHYSNQETYINNTSQINNFINLQIPTTPTNTRSKSLSPSPSPRPVVQQPIRIRHKKENTAFRKLQSCPNKNLKYLSLKSSNRVKTDDLLSSGNSDEISSVSEVSSSSSSTESEINISKSEIEGELSPKPFITIRLPSNVRARNLDNFPSNPTQSTLLRNEHKRTHSIAFMRMKKFENERVDFKSNLEILEENIQFIFDDRLKLLADEMRMEFIEPGLKRIKMDKDYILDSGDDLVLSLVENSKIQLASKLNNGGFNNFSKKGKCTNEALKEHTT